MKKWQLVGLAILTTLSMVSGPSAPTAQAQSPAAEEAGSWYMAAANPQRTSWVPENVPGKLQIEWYKPFEPFISHKVQVIAADGMLFVATARGLYALEADVPVTGRLGEGACRIWAEYLAPGADDVEILLRYGKANGWLDGQPAAVTRRSGAGRITYVGAWLDDALSLATVRWACEQAQVATPWDGLPNGVEISSRTGADRNVYVICNHGTSARKLVLPFSAFNVLEGRAADRELTIPANEVVVLTESTVDPAGTGRGSFSGGDD